MKTAFQSSATFAGLSASKPVEVNVVLGALENTGGILDLAAGLARGIHASLTVHFAQVVPYPLPLKSPPVPVELAERSLLDAASAQAVETSARVYLCRDRMEAIRNALKPESIVILSAKRRWWRTFESRLAQLLIRDGHRVILLAALRHHSHADTA